MGLEKRNHPRKDIKLAVSYENIDDFLTDYTSNVSIGGIFLATEVQMQKSHKIQLRIELPGGEEIKAVGVVQWVSRDSDSPEGVGLYFEVISKRDQRRIQRLLDDWNP